MTQEKLDSAKVEIERERLKLEREKWVTESQLREKELDIKFAEQRSREAEIELKREEQKRGGWGNPLIIAIFAAAIAATGNAVISIINGMQERSLEDQKSEQTRILEMIKTDEEAATQNLRFLLEAGLIDNPERARKLKKFVDTVKPGEGPSIRSQPFGGGILGADDAADVSRLDDKDGIRMASRAVGRLTIISNNNNVQSCTAFLVDKDLALTAAHCMSNATAAFVDFSDPDSSSSKSKYKVQLPPIKEDRLPSNNFSLLRLSGEPGKHWGILALSSNELTVDEKLVAVYFRENESKKQYVKAPDCKISEIEENVFHHGCDTGAGSAGSPILSREGLQVLGLHNARDLTGGMATRSDIIFQAIEADLSVKKVKSGYLQDIRHH